MYRSAVLLVGMMTSLSTVHGCAPPAKGVKQEQTVLRFRMQSLAGDEVDLSKYHGQVVMIVNVASKCGYTGQYEQLQKLHEKYAGQGLAILGLPCNQFLFQEPGSAGEIAAFCRTNYGVTFDMFAKVEVNGENACDLYEFLTSLDTQPKGAGKIGWNFEKFIVDRQGMVVARFDSGTKPDAPDVVKVIEAELAKGIESGTPPSADKQGLEQEVNLADFRWKNRIVLLFAPTPNDHVCFQAGGFPGPYPARRSPLQATRRE